MTRMVTAAAGLLFASALSAAWPLAADTYPRQTGFTIARYDFEITIGDASNEIQVRETVDLNFSTAGVSSVDLDLCGVNPQRVAGTTADPCMGARPAAAGGRAAGSPGGASPSGSASDAAPAAQTGMTVASVTARDQPLRFTHRNDRLHIDLATPSQPGARVSFLVAYHGTPATGLQIGNNKHGDRGFFSNDWPHLARNWLATIDHPSMKAPTAMTVIAPRHYQVVSNGRLAEATDLPGDLRRTSWREDAPIPTWQISLGAAPFAVAQIGVVRGIPLSSWVYPQEREDGFKGFGEHTAPILEFYIDHIGPYSYEKLAQVEANTVRGGMELASDIYYGYTGVPSQSLIAHEMAHQWFGDSVTERDWDDVWLSEGFATYFALLYQEHANGHDAFLAGVRSSADGAIRYALANPTSTIVHDNLADISKVIANNAQVYQGGAQVLHMLRGLLGDDRFWAGIRLYYQRHRDGNATSDDFRRAMEDACVDAGNCPDEDRDLSWFFHEWLNRGGIPQLKGTWHYDAVAHQLLIAVDQIQQTGLFRMPIEIGIMPAAPAGVPTGRGRAAAAPAAALPRIVIDQAHTTLTIPMDSEPQDVRLDPRQWVTMMQATFGKQ